MRRTPPALLLASLLALALVLAACGEREQPTTAQGGASDKLDVVLDYVPNADHAGLYAAQASGAFRDERLDVRLRVPNDPAAPLKLVQSGRADVAISYEPELYLARNRGADLIAFAALVNQPLTSLMSVGKDAVRRPAQLKGRTIGTAGIPYQDAYLKTILDRAGVAESDVRKVDVGFNLVPAMISGRVDATLGAFWNVEGVELARRKKDPQILRVDDLGVPTYDELVLVSTREFARNHGDLLRRFVQGLARGTNEVEKDPEAGLKPLLQANRDLDRAFTAASLKATLPVLQPPAGKPYGWMDEDEWAAYAEWMARNQLIRRQGDPRRALTTEFLPGEGPRPPKD